MPDWKYNQTPTIPTDLLNQLINAPSKNAAGINAFSQGAFGDSNQHGAMGAIQGMMQKQQQQKTMQEMINAFQNGQQGNSAFGGQMGGSQNPMMKAMGQNTTMNQDPLGLFGSGGGGFPQGSQNGQ